MRFGWLAAPRRTRCFWLAVLVLLLVPHHVKAQTWNWTSEDVDSQGESTWIATDA